MANGKQVHLDRLAQLSANDLAAVCSVVEQALMLGDGWLQRQADGTLAARDSTAVVIEERGAVMASNSTEHYVPLIVALDVWMALGFDSREFEPYVEVNGRADTWSRMLGCIRGPQVPCAKQVTETDWCVLSEDHFGPCYGADDVGLPNDLMVKRWQAQGRP